MSKGGEKCRLPEKDDESMKRQYLEMNVYDALQKRFEFLFREFDNIYISFSGGKDSGVLLNLLHPFRHYRYRMHQEDLAKQFGRFYREQHGGGKTVCLLGMRADESMHRYSGFLHKKYGYQGTCWISQQFKDVWCASPIYDWSVSDVWSANYRFSYDYNKLYDCIIKRA